MVHNLKKQREKLREELSEAGFDLNKKVDFWGKIIPLNKAIDLMDKGDIKDSYKMIDWKRKGLSVIKR
jgi:hypothetical protein